MKRFLTTTAAVTATFFASDATAATVKIQPIQVCNLSGSDCAAVPTFSDYVSKIYAQLDTTVEFLATTVFNSDDYLDIETRDEATTLMRSNFLSGTGRALLAYDMWFVKSLPSGLAGIAALGADGSIISDDILAINRVDTVAHEFGHNLGFDHTDRSLVDDERYLMSDGRYRTIPSTLDDIAPDGQQLSRFDPILPVVSVDTFGSTPSDSDDFFRVSFEPGAASDLYLKSVLFDLSPVTAFVDPSNVPPGFAGSPLRYGYLSGLDVTQITAIDFLDGSQRFELRFDDGVFSSGDELQFGVDIDLFAAIDAFGATPQQLDGMGVTYSFSNGYSYTSFLNDSLSLSMFDATANVDKGAVLFSDGDPLSTSSGLTPVPLPAGVWLLLSGLIASALVFGRRKAEGV